jgi:hypothetical protein
MNVAELQRLCQEYALKPEAKRKADYIKCLVAFSRDREAWRYVLDLSSLIAAGRLLIRSQDAQARSLRTSA